MSDMYKLSAALEVIRGHFEIEDIHEVRSNTETSTAFIMFKSNDSRKFVITIVELPDVQATSVCPQVQMAT